MLTLIENPNVSVDNVKSVPTSKDIMSLTIILVLLGMMFRIILMFFELI